jgi:iron complex outermembrane receptor protein
MNGINGTAWSVAIAAALAGAGGAQAQAGPDPDSAPRSAPGAAVGSAAPGNFRGLAPVQVTATRSPASVLGVPASVSVVDAQELEQRAPVRLGDAIADVPGVYVRGAALGVTYPGSGQAVLSLRGIPRTPRTLVMIDGQPVNNALTGGINVAGIPMGSVERVEVVRGPYSALYGGAAMGGVVNFITGAPDAPFTELRAGAGNLRQRGAAIVHRRRYESGLGVALSAGYRESDGDYDGNYVVKSQARGTVPTAEPVTGVRPTSDPDGSARYWVGTQGARPWSQSNAQFSLHFSPTTATKLAAGVGWADYSVGYARPTSFLRNAAGGTVFSGRVGFDDAGTTRQLSLAETDWFTATPAGERDVRAFARAEHRFAGGAELKAQLATLRHNLFFAQAAPGAASYDSGPGNLTDQPNQRVDGELSLHSPMSLNWVLVAGVSINHSTLDRQTLALSNWRETNTTGAQISADGGRSDNTAFFVQSEHYFDHGLTGYLGVRYDRYETAGYASRSTEPTFDESYPARSFDQFSPKLALVWEARRWLSLRASYGQGFRPPALFDLYGLSVIAAGPSTLVLEPSPGLVPERVRAFELGTDMAFAGGARASATLYRQRLEDLVYRRTLPGSTPTVTRTAAENVGQADVDGLEASVRWPLPPPGLLVFGALTHQFRYEISSNDVAPETVGKKLTDVPGTTWSAGLEFDRSPWSGLLAVRHVGHVFGSGDDMNLDTVQGVYGSFDSYTVVTARAGWRVDRHWRLNLSIDNLTGREYFVSTRQPGRTFYAEVVWNP